MQTKQEAEVYRAALAVAKQGLQEVTEALSGGKRGQGWMERNATLLQERDRLLEALKAITVLLRPEYTAKDNTTTYSAWEIAKSALHAK